MARRVDKPGTPKAAPKGAAEGSELQILSPDGEIVIQGWPITVREYRFFEGAKLQGQRPAFFDGLYKLFDRDSAPPGFEQVEILLGEHEDDVAAMVALACGCEEQWVRELDDLDGNRLMLAWWMANSGFFIRRVLRRAAAARLRAGVESSTTSSLPATSEHPQTSPP